jgi:hypothetical protein
MGKKIGQLNLVIRKEKRERKERKRKRKEGLNQAQ